MKNRFDLSGKVALLRREITLASKLDHLYQNGSRLMVGMRIHG